MAANALTFIHTSSLPRVETPEGELTEILNQHLAGARNVLGMLRWISPGQTFTPEKVAKHQLIYLMEGEGKIRLEDKDYEVTRGAGVYLGPSEIAMLQASDHATMKLFHLVVPHIPK